MGLHAKNARNIKCCSAPHFHAKSLRMVLCKDCSNPHHINRSHTLVASKRLVCITESGIGKLNFFLFFSHCCKFFRTQFIEFLFCSVCEACLDQTVGIRGLMKFFDGSFFFTSGFPFTRHQRDNARIFVPLSCFVLNMKQLRDCFSINLTVALPSRKIRMRITFSRKGIFVFTPRIRNSSNVRYIDVWHRSRYVRCAVTFASIESKKGEIFTPWYELPSSNRIPYPPAFR